MSAMQDLQMGERRMSLEQKSFVIKNIPLPEKVPTPRFKNLVGIRFERLVVVSRKENTKWNEARWLCKCDCGNETIVTGKLLISGNTKSCGCYHKDAVIASGIKRSIFKNCEICNAVIRIKQSHTKEGVYCSKECKSLGYKERFGGANNPNYRHGQCGTAAYERKMGNKWRKNNKDKIKIINRNTKLKRKAVPGEHSLNDIKNKFKEQWGACYWCFEPLHEYHIDHIIPVSKGGTNNPDNICIACPACNLQKKAQLPEDWINSKNYRGRRKYVTL